MVSATPGLKPKRRRFFRNVRVRLKCGHECVLTSTLFRLTPARIRGMISGAVRQGMLRCEACAMKGHPRAVVRTERGAEG